MMNGRPCRCCRANLALLVSSAVAILLFAFATQVNAANGGANHNTHQHDPHLPTSFGDDGNQQPPLAGHHSTQQQQQQKAMSAVDFRAEEERILAQHFPNKDDSDYEDGDEDDDDEDGEYDDDDSIHGGSSSSSSSGSSVGSNFFDAHLTAAEESADPDPLPVLINEPRSAFVTRQQPATLRCKAAHALQLHIICSGHVHPPQVVQDAHVDPQTGVHVQEVIATVSADLVTVVRHPAASNSAGAAASGPFRCECHAISARGKTKSQPPVSVELAYMRKQFSAQPLSMRVHAGNRTELICGAPKAYPAPIVEWLHNNVSVRNDSLAVLLTGNGSLVISGATVQDSGNYTCIARNIAGTQVSTAANLIVYVDGAWSPWSLWTDCTAGCTSGRSSTRQLGRMRSRTCTQPAPMNGGAQCTGSATMQTKDCRVAAAAATTSAACNEEIVVASKPALAVVTTSASSAFSSTGSVWTQWTDWTECSVECIQVRRRSCTDGRGRLRSDCGGREFQTQPCQMDMCPSSAAGGHAPSTPISGFSWMLFLGLGIVCGAGLTAGAALTRCTRRKRARLPAYRLTQTDDLQLTESSKQDMSLSDWRQHQYCAVV